MNSHSQLAFSFGALLPPSCQWPHPSLVGLYLIGGRFRAHGVSLLRTAPTFVLDNGLSKLWFRKLLKFPARRLIYWAKLPGNEFPYHHVVTLQYLIAAFSHSESRLSVN